MLIKIGGVLNSQQLSAAKNIIHGGKYKDGDNVGPVARAIKNNSELVLGEEQYNKLNSVVMGNLCKSEEFNNAAFPLKIAQPIYASYTPGKYYGNHVDEAVMGPLTGRYRSDVSMTVFLNGPADYDGGELIIQTLFGESQVKLAAGDVVIYPSSSVHRIAEVTRGERLVAVSWIQSLVRDPEKRLLLYKLGKSLQECVRSRPEAKETLDILDVYTNLKRMWSDL